MYRDVVGNLGLLGVKGWTRRREEAFFTITAPFVEGVNGVN